MNRRRMDPRHQSRLVMQQQQQALIRSQLAQAAATMPPEQLNAYMVAWHGHGHGHGHGGPVRGGAGGGGRAAGPGPGPIPSLSSGQGFYTVESLQGTTAVPPQAVIAHSGHGLMNMRAPLAQPAFDGHHPVHMVMHPMPGHKALVNMETAAGSHMLSRAFAPEHRQAHIFVSHGAPQHQHPVLLQTSIPQRYQHPGSAALLVRPQYMPRERDRGRGQEREPSRSRVRERERERERERHREREPRQVEKFRSKKGRMRQASPPPAALLRQGAAAGKSKRKQPLTLGPGGPGWCKLCQVECNTEDMLQQHIAGKRHKRHLQKLDGDLDGSKGRASSASDRQGMEEVSGSDFAGLDGSDLGKKSSSNELEIEEQKSKKPRLDDSGSEIGTLDFSTSIGMELSAKPMEVSSRLDEGEQEVEGKEQGTGSPANVQVLRDNEDCTAPNCGKEDSVRSLGHSDSEGAKTEELVACSSLQPKIVEETTQASQQGDANISKDPIEQGVCASVQRADVGTSPHEQVIDSEDEWNDEEVDSCEKLVVVQNVLTREVPIGIVNASANDKVTDCEDCLELLDYEDLLTDEEGLHVMGHVEDDTAYEGERIQNCDPDLLVKFPCGLEQDVKEDGSAERLQLCLRAVLDKSVATSSGDSKDVVKSPSGLSLQGEVIAGGGGSIEADTSLDGEVPMDVEEFVVKGNAVSIWAEPVGISSGGTRHLHEDLIGGIISENESASSGDTILLDEASSESEQPIDDEMTLICKEMCRCDSLFDEDEELHDLCEERSDMNHDVAGPGDCVDLGVSVHGEQEAGPATYIDVAKKDEVLKAFGNGLSDGKGVTGLIVDKMYVVESSEETMIGGSSGNVSRYGEETRNVEILTDNENLVAAGEHLRTDVDADKASDAGSSADHLSKGDCFDNTESDDSDGYLPLVEDEVPVEVLEDDVSGGAFGENARLLNFGVGVDITQSSQDPTDVNSPVTVQKLEMPLLGIGIDGGLLQTA